MGFLTSRALRRDNEQYKGLLNGCAPGTHQAIVSRLLASVPHRSGVLDLGAGSGALLLRLRDAGFTDLHAADLAADNFGIADVPHTRIDLNGDFARAFSRTFKIVCMSEVLEHLDAPRNALRQARALLDEDGYLVLTVPNVAFWEGRVKFMLNGELWGFGEAHFKSLRHISPMTRGQLRLTLREVGFSPIEELAAGSFATPFRRVLLSPLWLPFLAMGGTDVLGECTVVLARKAEPDLALTRPTIYDQVWESSAREQLPKAAPR